MKLIIFGANGAIGAECVRQAINDKDIEHVTAVTRRPLDQVMSSDKLTNVIHTDFLDYTTLLNLFETHQGCIWALGISQNAVSETEYIKITYDYTLSAAKAMASVKPNIKFIFVSGMGADSTETSRYLFGRIKGKTENDLVHESGLSEIYTVRPGGIIFSERVPHQPWLVKALVPVLYLVRFVKPSWIINSIALARAILYLVKHGHHATLFESQDLKDIVTQNNLF